MHWGWGRGKHHKAKDVKTKKEWTDTIRQD